MPAGHPDNGLDERLHSNVLQNQGVGTRDSMMLTETKQRDFRAACWHDMVMADGTVFHAPGVFASDYVPLWAGVAAAGSALASSVVFSLQHSGKAASHTTSSLVYVSALVAVACTVCDEA